MSLKTTFPDEIPEETRQLGETLLSEDNVYRLVGQEAEQMIDEKPLAEMYDREGRGAVNPVLLALVLVFQFLEKLPDRQAAQMAVMRMDWKYALRQPLNWTAQNASSSRDRKSKEVYPPAGQAGNCCNLSHRL